MTVFLLCLPVSWG